MEDEFVASAEMCRTNGATIKGYTPSVSDVRGD